MKYAMPWVGTRVQTIQELNLQNTKTQLPRSLCLFPDIFATLSVIIGTKLIVNEM